MESALFQALADERRRILSVWRAVVLLQRAYPMIARSSQTTASALPKTPEEAHRFIKSLIRRDAIEPIRGNTHIYLVTGPYAETIAASELEVIGEVNPYAALSHFSALDFHGLTLQLPTSLYATHPSQLLGNELPIGTTQDDWDINEFIPGNGTPSTVLGSPIKWKAQSSHDFFGHVIRSPYGYPIRVTDVDRTLIDAIDTPAWCGGILNVMESWKSARERINVVRLIDYVDRLGRALLRQRVGYLLETLGLSHPTLNIWKQASVRGGSMKLDGSMPYSPIYSAEWNLSLNAPIEVLEDDAS
jgi:predicted transcriptional regulator of viral defense system